MYAAIYHALYDRPLASARRVVVEMVPEGSTVLDVGCGTGELCFELAERKGCRVVGVDRSHRMIEFARKRNRHRSVRFMLGDATGLTAIAPASFDCATVMLLLHEMPLHGQIQVLDEALRVARRVVVVDSRAPLPWNFHGIALRLAEASAGPGHFLAFMTYLAAGGIAGVLSDEHLRSLVILRSVFWHDGREMVVFEGPHRPTGTPMSSA